MQPEDFDAWRAKYRDMSVADHAAFYARIHAEYPDQKNYDAAAAIEFFDAIPEDGLSVLELGGHDGGLARECLQACSNIYRWCNYDISPPERQQPEDDRYWAIHLKEHLWITRPRPIGSVFVASHVIEHLDVADFKSLIGSIGYSRYVFLDAPLGDSSAVNWTGATAAHNLDLSWDEVIGLMAEKNYVLTAVRGSSRSFKKAR